MRQSAWHAPCSNDDDPRHDSRVGSTAVVARPGTIVRMPANVPHAVEASTPARLLLVMIREPKAA